MPKLHWSNFDETLKNIHDMYIEVKKAYDKNGHAEIALVFASYAGEHNRPYFYDTDENSYRVVIDQVVEENGRELYRKLDTQRSVDELKAKAANNGCTEYYITTMHNHRTGAFFGFVDIHTFILENCMKEFFLDASTCICCFIKQRGNKMTRQDADNFVQETVNLIDAKKRELALRIIAAFEKAEKIENELERLKLFGENRDEDSKERFTGRLKRVFYLEMRDSIHDEILDQVINKLECKMNWVRIPKRILTAK
ncbi:MAG: hypothetical protein FWG36_06820 [Oscillospiraceae bacterium]|nr:hypothetical protein [Oscillospiraceae bacterium]